MSHGQALTVARTILEHLARVTSACPNIRIDGLQTTSLSVQGRRSIHQFGRAGHGGTAPCPWSLILKVIEEPESADPNDAAAERMPQTFCHFDAWHGTLLPYGMPQARRIWSYLMLY